MINHIFIQARYESSRLRGKVLKKINNKPVLLILIEKLKKLRNSKIVILTSINKSDDKIVRFCRKNSINYFRGSHHNVYERYCEAIKFYKSDFFIRICGDSPLQSEEIINRMISLYKKKKKYILTNVFPRSFPIGMSVEIINSKFFLKKKIFIKDKISKEHITTYFYKNEKKNIYNYQNNKNFSKINLSINTIDDFKKIKLFLENSEKNYTFNKLIKYFR